MTVSPWQRSLAEARYDVAIIGGGITGTATAHAIAQMRPGLSIAIIESARLAHGASGRNAGFLLLGTHADYASAVDAYGRETARRVWAFTSESLTLALALPGGGATRTGSVLAAGTPDEAQRLQRSRDLMAEDGIEALWDAAPYAGTAGFLGSLVVPDGGAVDPARLVRALAQQSGAEIIEHTTVARLGADGDGVRLELDGGGEIRAGRVLVATNARTGDLVPSLAEAVQPVRAQMLATEPVAPFLPAPVYSHDGFYYVRQASDGNVLVGGARHRHEADEVGHDDETTGALQSDLEAYLAAHFPAAARARIVRRWSGTMGFSPDGLPLLGDVPGVRGAHVAAGFTGHGMGYSLRFGRLAARRLLGESDDADSLFDARRIAS